MQPAILSPWSLDFDYLWPMCIIVEHKIVTVSSFYLCPREYALFVDINYYIFVILTQIMCFYLQNQSWNASNDPPPDQNSPAAPWQSWPPPSTWPWVICSTLLDLWCDGLVVPLWTCDVMWWTCIRTLSMWWTFRLVLCDVMDIILCYLYRCYCRNWQLYICRYNCL